jgi:glycosyltransferase 2 family protein
VGAFFHAVGVFFDHLAAVRWTPLGIALGLNVLKLFFRAIAWRTILSAAYPRTRVKLSSVFGAYVVGVGINSIAPARGGDLVKLYLMRHRIEGSSYATLGSTLVVETLFDFFVAGAIMVWALSLGVLPAKEVYSRIPTVDWKWFVEHPRVLLAIVITLAVAAMLSFIWARRRVRRFREHVAQGFAVLHDRPRFFRGVLVPQLISWVLRLAALYYFLKAFSVPASLHNALLVQAVDSLATLFPATPGGAGTKQGLIVYLFRGEDVSRTLLVSFSVGMNIALVVCNLVLGLAALALMARTLSWKRLRQRQQTEEQTA